MQIDGNPLETYSPKATDTVVPLSWAFVTYMNAKVKKADQATIGEKFMGLFEGQGKYLILKDCFFSLNGYQKFVHNTFVCS